LTHNLSYSAGNKLTSGNAVAGYEKVHSSRVSDRSLTASVFSVQMLAFYAIIVLHSFLLLTVGLYCM